MNTTLNALASAIYVSRQTLAGVNITEDDQKNYENDIQKLTDQYCKDIDTEAAAKEKEILEL